jgi:hypothetical protein
VALRIIFGSLISLKKIYIILWTITGWPVVHSVNFLSQNFCGHIFFKFYMVRPFQNAQILAFWFSKRKVMTVWRYFFYNFDQKSDQLQNIISRKQKIRHLQNFDHWFLTCQSVFLQNFNQKWESYLFLDLNGAVWNTNYIFCWNEF